MGTKRPHTDLTTVHASRQINLQSASQPTHKRARRESDDHLTTSKPSANVLRKKIRDTTRVLNHSTQLPADARLEHERALAGYRQDLEAVEEGKRRAKMIKRYHMVRFFERQKATRHLKKLRRRLAETTADGEERKSLETLVHVAEVDLNYAVYCPLQEKYTSLYPQKQDGKDEQAVVDRHMGEKSWLPMWGVVERCMEEGTLEALRNGKGQGEMLESGGDGGEAAGGVKAERRPGIPIPIRAKKRRREERVDGRDRQDEEGGSDGGFFEE